MLCSIYFLALICRAEHPVRGLTGSVDGRCGQHESGAARCAQHPVRRTAGHLARAGGYTVGGSDRHVLQAAHGTHSREAGGAVRHHAR